MAANKPRKYLRRLFLVFVSVTIATAVAEVAVRIFVPVRNVGPSFSTFDSEYGRKLKRDFSCTRITPEFTMRFTTNSRGFRGPEFEDNAAAPILFIGDSFTMGYGVNDGEEFPALIGKKLSSRSDVDRVSVVNAGIGNVGNGRWLRFLREEAVAMEPRMIVLQIAANDFSDNIKEALVTIGTDGEIIERVVRFERGMKHVVQTVVEAVPGLAYVRLVSLLRQLPLRRGAPVAAQADQAGRGNDEMQLVGRHITLGIIKKIIQTCRNREWPLLVISAELGGERLAQLSLFLAREGVEIVDLPTKSARPDLFYKVDGHWKASGHRHAADRIWGAILSSPQFASVFPRVISQTQ